MLHESEDFRFIHVEQFGIVRSYNPRMSRGDFHTLVYVSINSSHYGHLFIYLLSFI